MYKQSRGLLMKLGNCILLRISAVVEAKTWNCLDFFPLWILRSSWLLGSFFKAKPWSTLFLGAGP
jgi:hypothetical protein